MNELKEILAHLDGDYNEPIRDPLWKHIYLSRELKAMIQSKPFSKLSRIRQLGPTVLVYPGATHTRFSHSLGVFHVAKRMIRSLLYRDPPDYITLSGVKSFLAAALLHDQGHFPYAHSLKELPLEDHEALTAHSMLEKPLVELIESFGADPVLSADIVDTGRSLDPGTSHGKEAQFFRSLLSGVLDPDKLDYLNRDAFFSGVPYGIQDIDFIFSRLYPLSDGGVGIDSKGIPSVEAILFSKYLMYRSVYWHREVRTATAMIKKAVIDALDAHSIAPDILYGLDDASFVAIMEKTGNSTFNLVQGVFDGNLYRVSHEVPFEPGNPLHRRLEDLKHRSDFEKKAAERLRERGVIPKDGHLIVDIPETISFESDLFVIDEGVPFSRSSSPFAKGIVDGFARELRVLRILAPVSIGKTELAELGF